MREFEETIVTPMSTEDADLLREKLKSHDLQLSRGGRFYAVTGETDKGMAVRKLTELFRSKLGDVTTVGIGDSANDLPMLAAVEQPILVQKSDGIWEENTLPNLRRVAGIGPSGWSEFVTELLGD
jgi:predicted mannosyl-3-phosphoglycerate phosphatase (HAD superfamily)